MIFKYQKRFRQIRTYAVNAGLHHDGGDEPDEGGAADLVLAVARYPAAHRLVVPEQITLLVTNVMYIWHTALCTYLFDFSNVLSSLSILSLVISPASDA